MGKTKARKERDKLGPGGRESGASDDEWDDYYYGSDYDTGGAPTNKEEMKKKVKDKMNALGLSSSTTSKKASKKSKPSESESTSKKKESSTSKSTTKERDSSVAKLSKKDKRSQGTKPDSSKVSNVESSSKASKGSKVSSKVVTKAAAANVTSEDTKAAAAKKKKKPKAPEADKGSSSSPKVKLPTIPKKKPTGITTDLPKSGVIPPEEDAGDNVDYHSSSTETSEVESSTKLKGSDVEMAYSESEEGEVDDDDVSSTKSSDSAPSEEEEEKPASVDTSRSHKKLVTKRQSSIGVVNYNLNPPRLTSDDLHLQGINQFKMKFQEYLTNRHSKVVQLLDHQSTRHITLPYTGWRECCEMDVQLHMINWWKGDKSRRPKRLSELTDELVEHWLDSFVAEVLTSDIAQFRDVEEIARRHLVWNEKLEATARIERYIASWDKMFRDHGLEKSFTGGSAKQKMKGKLLLKYVQPQALRDQIQQTITTGDDQVLKSVKEMYKLVKEELFTYERHKATQPKQPPKQPPNKRPRWGSDKREVVPPANLKKVGEQPPHKKQKTVKEVTRPKEGCLHCGAKDHQLKQCPTCSTEDKAALWKQNRGFFRGKPGAKKAQSGGN